MTLTPDTLKQISPGTPLDRCAEFTPHLNKYLPQYGIDAPVEVASFLSQILHESGGLKYLREIWGPTAQQNRYERDPAQPWPGPRGGRNWLAYALGNEFKGDGKKFAGKGPIQITGRSNFARMSRDMFGDNRLLDNPDILATPEFGIQSACIYWKWRNMDAVDDDTDIKTETKRVNGGFNGLDDRQRYFDRCRLIFNF